MDRALKRIQPQAGHSREPLTADEFYVNRAIELAWHGAGRAEPNPLVGAVVVRAGRVVGEGFHAGYGLEHAETVALDAAGEATEGATLYVTLEPCTHYGKTPPCTDRILESGVRRVVVSTRDPDPRMNGRGVHILREHGLQVDVGAQAARALLLNLPYFKRVLGLGMLVTLKMAATLDGRIASQPGRRDDITGPEARRFVHRLRAVHQGVVVGINTLLVDRPRLDCRLLPGVTPPAPVVLDSRLRFPLSYPWIDEGREFIVVTGDSANGTVGSGAVRLKVPTGDGPIDLDRLLAVLRERDIGSVLVEGGAKVFSSFINQGLWDALYVFVSPKIFGPDGVAMSGRAPLDGSVGAALAGVATFDGDVLLSYLNERTKEALFERLLEG
jgi:diaminohydroxyphosphoribosylaminopyrimidine deaminase/5-amino-6-(5-phosphoribosylamino)uracil reductase